MKRILILDDDADIRALIRSTLAAEAVEVFGAGTGTEAKATLERFDIDLVIVDGVLPDTSGVDFIARLRETDPHIVVVFVSAFFRDLETFKRLTEQLNVALVARKPIDTDQFSNEIAKLLAGPEIQTPPPTRQEVLDLELAELRGRFAAKLPEKLSNIRQELTSARAEPASLMKAKQATHRLRGSAGSYGFTALSQAVSRIEDLIRKLEQCPPQEASGLWEQIDIAVNDAFVAGSGSPSGNLEGPGPDGKALLVVESDTEVAALIQRAARNNALRLITAQSGQQALELAGNRPLLAAIIDVHLHGEEDSFVLARRLRETPGNGDIPIGFISDDGRIATRVAAIEAGGSKFFEKPVSPESLAEALQSFVHSSVARHGRVLIVDDDLDASNHYSLYLRTVGYGVDQLASADNLVERLEQTRPDLLLLDVELPGVSGIDICRALRMSERWELLPILVVTAHVDPQTRLQAFRAGANDVLAKPVLSAELLARVGVQVDRARLIQERADKDPLSGLLLRRAFLEAFTRITARCEREHRQLSIAMLDIDNFKTINDTYGHLAGDEVIAKLGELLRRRFRAEDLRARWGGEEFLIVFVDQGADFAQQAVSRLRVEFSEQRFCSDAGEHFAATFTAGIAVFPHDGDAVSSLIRCADERLYVGKSQGKNRVIAGTTRLALG